MGINRTPPLGSRPKRPPKPAHSDNTQSNKQSQNGRCKPRGSSAPYQMFVIDGIVTELIGNEIITQCDIDDLTGGSY